MLQEAIIAPLFFYIGTINNKKEFIDKIRTTIILVLVIYVFLAFIIYIFSSTLVTGMKQNINLTEKTVEYIRLESIANIFIIISQLFIIIFLTLNDYRKIFIISIVKTFIIVILDIVFIRNMDIGVNAIAYNNIISNFIIIITSLFLLNKIGFNILDIRIPLSFDFKRFGNVQLISGVESLYRNLIFGIMILRMINIVGEQGNYWIANNFMWGFLLMPILQLGEIIKK